MGSFPSRGISSSFHRQDVGAGFFFFFSFGKTKGSLLLLLMYFCSSLNKKLWFLKGCKAGRGQVACRKGERAFRISGLFWFWLCLWNAAEGRSGAGLCPVSYPCHQCVYSGSLTTSQHPPCLPCPSEQEADSEVLRANPGEAEDPQPCRSLSPLETPALEKFFFFF